ncbi:MAG TPA: hypothetical protein VK932_00850, partial [Kofleriaceae bacterium]|nr:hypothetical protein [Kofleriaceae bacterium]
MSVDRPRAGAAATCFDSRVAAAAIGAPATRAPAPRSPATRLDSRAVAAAMPAGPATARTLIGYQPAGALRDAPSTALRVAALARAAEDSARTTEWEPHEIELTLDELDELAPRAELDP